MLSKKARRELEVLGCTEPEDLGPVEVFEIGGYPREIHCGGHSLDSGLIAALARFEQPPRRPIVRASWLANGASRPPGTGEVILHRKPRAEEKKAGA